MTARALAGMALLLALAGCAATPDAQATAPAPADAPAARMAPSLAGTGFGQTVARAVETHPGLRAGGARVAAAEAQRASEASRRRPQVVVGGDGVQLAGSGASRATPILQVQQLLYDGGAVRARVEAAEAQIARSRSDRIGIAAQLALRAVEATFRLAHERRLLALAEDNLAIHREFLAQIEDRLDAGAGTEADLLTARSRLADATARSVSARGRLERAEASYREIYGVPPGPAPETRPAPALPSGSDAQLIATSPRLQSLVAEQAAARAALVAVEAGRLPSLTVGVTGRRRDGGGASVTADVGLRYDLATGGEREAAIRSAAARVAEVDAERQDLEREIGRALEFVRSDERTGRERLAAARAALAANEAAVAAAREQFQVGRRSITQLLDAQRDFLGAAEAAAQAELDLALSGYAALALTGDILHVFGIGLPDGPSREQG